MENLRKKTVKESEKDGDKASEYTKKKTNDSDKESCDETEVEEEER